MPAKSSKAAPLILACDTTQGACSAALWRDGVLAAQLAPMAKGHAEALMPMIDILFQESGVAISALDRLAVTHGPGSFTGVRVGLSAMRGLALALARPLKTYGTLDVMARACACDTPLMIAVDARRETFYCQAFMANGAAYTQPQALTGAQAVALAAELSAAQEAEHGPQIALCGTGAAILGDASPLFSPLTAAPYPDAVTLAEMAAQDAAWDDLPPAEPLYLRAPDATLPDARKRIQWQS